MKSRHLRKAIAVIVSAVLILGVIACAGLPTNDATRKEQARLHTDLGSAYLKSGQYPAALQEFLEAEKLRPDDPETHYLLGISYDGIRLTEKAIGEFTKAIDLKPGYSEAHNYLGSIYLRSNLYDKAISEFAAALTNELYTTPAVALNNMGWAYYKKGDYKTAVAKYLEALERNPNTRIPFIIQKNIGVAYLADNNIERAIYHLNESIRIAQYIAESHYWLGMAYLKKRNIKNAVKEFRFAVEIDPESQYGDEARKQLDEILAGRY